LKTALKSVDFFFKVKAKFHYAIWFEAGRREVRSWFEAGRRPAASWNLAYHL